jgi:tRNA (guanine-N7-)-methyltransferase
MNGKINFYVPHPHPLSRLMAGEGGAEMFLKQNILPASPTAHFSSSREFQRELAQSRELPEYYHLRLLKDSQGKPLMTTGSPPRPAPLDITAFFGAPPPIEIEIGCGKGTFMTAYGEKHPGLPFLALDKEAGIAHLAAGRLASKRAQIPHVRVVLGDALIFFRDFLPEACARAFHIYFPDPWPKRRHHKHRLMSGAFLEQIRRVAMPQAVLRFATDHEDYNRETRGLFARTPWLEMIDPDAEPTEGIQTNFEIKYRRIGRPIHRCVLRLHV